MFLAGVIVSAVKEVSTEAVESEAENQVVKEREKVGEGGKRRASERRVWYIHTADTATSGEFYCVLECVD